MVHLCEPYVILCVPCVYPTGFFVSLVCTLRGSLCPSVFTLRNSLWVHACFHPVAVALQVRPCALQVCACAFLAALACCGLR